MVVSTVCVKVVGFSDTERHSLNTLFRLSQQTDVVFSVWTADSGDSPDVVLVDTDNPEVATVIAAAAAPAQSQQKIISVGQTPLDSAWRSFARPVDWNVLLEVLAAVGLGKETPSRSKACLLLGFSAENGLYLRARLALAGLYEVEEAKSAAQAQTKMKDRAFSLVLADLSSNDMGAWALVQSMTQWSERGRCVVVATSDRSTRAQRAIDQLGCAGVLEIPFAPHEVVRLLNQVKGMAPFLQPLHI